MKYIVKSNSLNFADLPFSRPLVAMDTNNNFRWDDGIPSNEIWYTTINNNAQIYDWQSILDMITPMGATYLGPNLISNEWDSEKHVYRMVFDGIVDTIGVDDQENLITHIFFMSNNELGLNCNVNTIILPNSVNEIKDNCFYVNTNLTSINLGKNITIIHDYVFAGCTSLTSITIPNTVTRIGDNAFWQCGNLTSITIPNGVTYIGAGAFSGTGLTSITIPPSMTSINGWLFSESSLRSINISSSVTSIGNSAFWHCGNLTSITIPSSVTNIGVEAFDFCSSLTSITCKAVLPPSGTLSWTDVDKTIPVYVPLESISAYQAAESWSDFTNIQAIQG